MSSLAAANHTAAASLTRDPAMRSTGTAPPLFTPDVDGEDSLGRAVSARLLADFVCDPGAGTPLIVAVTGSAGSGKSSILRRIRDHVRDAGAAARGVLAVWVDASRPGDAAAGLIGALHAVLRTSFPDLAEEALHAGDDPLQAARAANDHVAELRRRLDAERGALDDLQGRQARLVDTVLFDTPGARIDGYARTSRARIEGRLRAFGLPVADPIVTYKDLVREAAPREGGGSRIGLTLRALWGYNGQGTLLVLAILLLVLGWACGTLADNPNLWIDWLTGWGEKGPGLLGWAQDHAGWLPTLSHGAYALAALAVLIDILRAFRFLQPIMRGATLLSGDIEERRRDVDGLLAHQTRRVDHLVAEVDAAVAAAAAAERRIERRREAGAAEVPPRFAGQAGPDAAAEAFLSAVQRRLAAGGAAPRRIVVLIDELDRLPRPASADYLDTVHRLLRRPGLVTLVAFDRQRVLDGFSDTDPADAAARLGRCVQLSFDLDAEASVADTLGLPVADLDHAGLDRPWQDHETDLLRALSVAAGPNPRAVKRFVNSYRLARADPKMAGATPAEAAGLALALALDHSGGAAELGAYESSGEIASAELGDVVAAAQAAIGQEFTVAEARRGLKVARIYGRRG